MVTSHDFLQEMDMKACPFQWTLRLKPAALGNVCVRTGNVK
jgi:hypothetical protein